MSFFPDLYRAAIEALAGQGLRVLVTIGDKADPGDADGTCLGRSDGVAAVVRGPAGERASG